MGSFHRVSLSAACGIFAGVAAVWTGTQAPLRASAALSRVQAEPRCRVEGRARSGNVALPGVAIVVQVSSVLKAATSTDVEGKYAIFFSPNASYHVSADLTAFTRVERDITLGPPPCDLTLDFELALKSRREPEVPATSPSAGRGRGAPPGPIASRFQALNVQADASAAATTDMAPPDDSSDVERLLPPGFSLQTAQADAIAITGSNDATSLDRGLMNDRGQAIRLGALDPATGLFAGFGPQGGPPAGGLGAQDDGIGGPGGGRGGG